MAWKVTRPEPCQHIGEILKERVEAKMIQECDGGQYSKDRIVRHLKDVLKDPEFNNDHFKLLL